MNYKKVLVGMIKMSNYM